MLGLVGAAVADLDLGIAADRAGDEVFDQPALPLLGHHRQAVSRPRAERLRALGEARGLRPQVDLGPKLPRLSVQGPPPLFQLAAPPVLGEAEHAVEAGRGEPIERLAQACRATVWDLSARLQLPRQPVATTRGGPAGDAPVGRATGAPFTSGATPLTWAFAPLGRGPSGKENACHAAET